MRLYTGGLSFCFLVLKYKKNPKLFNLSLYLKKCEHVIIFYDINYPTTGKAVVQIKTKKKKGVEGKKYSKKEMSERKTQKRKK